MMINRIIGVAKTLRVYATDTGDAQTRGQRILTRAATVVILGIVVLYVLSMAYVQKTPFFEIDKRGDTIWYIHGERVYRDGEWEVLWVDASILKGGQ